MRYIIETTDAGNDQSVWNSINTLRDKGYITVVEKGDPIEEMKENLRKVARAMELLRDVGISNDLMVAFILQRTKIAQKTIKLILSKQDEFFRNIGVKLK